MTAPLPSLPPDLAGFAAAVATQDNELPFTWEGIKDTVYGSLYYNAQALLVLESAVEHCMEGRHELARETLRHVISLIDEAVNFGYSFASVEFADIAEQRGIDPDDDEAYDAFVAQRMEHALDESYDETPDEEETDDEP